jgi:hypothetical protein
MDPSQEDIEQFWKIYPNLPPAVKKALFSEETAKTISYLANEYNLENQPTSKLANIVGDVLLGLTKLHQVTKILQKEYQLPEEEASQLATELENSIFQPLKGGMKDLNYVKPASPSGLKDIYGEPVE